MANEKRRGPIALLACLAALVLSFDALAQSPPTSTPPRSEPPRNKADAAPRAHAPRRRPVTAPRTHAPRRRPLTAPRTRAPAPPPKPAPRPAPPDDTGFSIGSYGRIGATWNSKGNPGDQPNIVSAGPRLGEPSYLEVDLYYRLRPFKKEKSAALRRVRLNTVFTLAFTEEFFHFSGDFTAMFAVRNLYIEATGLFLPGLSVWIGSRMYRGDQIYLFDYWPLDNLNTIGGGAQLAIKKTQLAWQIGVNRLSDQYQFQEVPVPGRFNSSEDVVLLDRQRLITSLRFVQHFGGDAGRFGFKLKLYGEYHHLGPGTLDANLPEPDQEALPRDHGWLLGLQLGAWNFGPRAHANLWLRYSQGLAAYGEFAIPFGLAADKRAAKARALVVGGDANYELKRWFGVQVAAYVRHFRDADPNKFDWDDGWEYVVAARPHLFLHSLFLIAIELSYQGRLPAGLDPWTNTAVKPGVFQLAIMPTLTFGKGTYGRPHFRFIYLLYHQNQGARFHYNPVDPRARIKVGHFIGLQAEWWYNSTYR